MSLITVTYSAWENTEKHDLGGLGEAQWRLRLTITLDVCKMNFHTVMLLQCKVCTVMVSIGGGKKHFFS